jgi:signal transduction histidine kinase
MKNDFVATVSHELRTPLSSLRGFIELMLKRDYPPEKRRQFLEVIHRESQRLTDLVNDVLDLQRIESGQQVFRFEPVSIAEVVHGTADVFAGSGEAHPIMIDIPPEIPLVFADPELVRQVISNLVSNALKYSSEGAAVRIGARADPGQVLVWVSDEGIGIPPELLSKIFSRFYRVDNTATRKIGGTGLGLALVKDIVEAHGGRVWAESALRKGSTFYFTLKVAEQDGLAA